jgi:hypothetical protein
LPDQAIVRPLFLFIALKVVFMMSRSLSGRLLSLVFSTILTGAIATIPARADDCSNEKELKSPPSSATSEISFQNRAGEKRRIYWIDQDGDRKFYGIVEPGNVFKQPTLVGHAWVVTDDAEKCLYSFVASAEPQSVDVGEVAAAVAPPAPGGQQPIAQAPAPQVVAPPPAVVQAPPPVAQPAPPPPVAAAPPPPVQDPQTVMAEIPQISPIEQFDLRGVFRISPRANASIALNSEAAGTIFVMNVKPEWDSGQWAFEPVPGLPFVRIKNQWKKTYLTDVGGKLRATSATPDADEAHWTFEPVDGTPFVQFRNRETDRFLIVAGDAPALVDDLRQNQEDLSQWKVGPSGRAAAAAPPPPPRNSAYDAALANCRELGGYWTGSSCRASIISQPLVCPRGYAWSEDVGECQWDGGGCPPWQVGPGGQCLMDLSCRGGVVRMSRRGFPACYCPLGYVVWGDYPRLACVPSVARIAPLLIGGAAIAILGANQGRPQIGQVYGNKRFCGPGQTGTPPNCVAATSCTPPLVGTPPNCLRLVPRPTPVNATTCAAGQIGTPPNCVTPPPPVIGGGGASCPSDSTGTPPNCICKTGTTGQPGSCKAASTIAPPTTCGPNRVGTPPNCQCAPGRSGPNCAPDAPCDPRTQTGTPGQCVDKVIPCEGGVVDRSSGTCTCGSGKGAVNGVCVAKTCSGGQMVGDQCRCSNPNQTPQRTSFTTFVCAGTGATACPSDSTGTPPSCICKTGTTGQPGSCKPAGTIAPQGGGGGTNPIVQPASCGANRVGTPPDCQCAPGRSGPACAPDAPCDPRTQTGTPGKCVDKVIPCEGGVVDRASGTCTCGSGKGVVNGVCVAKTCSGGQMVGDQCRCSNPNQTPQRTSFTTFVCAGTGATACPSDSTGTPPSCTCKTGTTGQPGACKPAGTGTPGAPTGLTPTQPTACPTGMTGTPPNCVANPKVDRVPAKCPDGMTGTPPNCVKPPPAACPQGMTGTPPNCVKPPPAACPQGMTGTPPNCVKPPPAACPQGMTGTPPNCVKPPPATCPAGTTGTPPNCVKPPPAACPAGTTGTPPNCVKPPAATCPAGTTGTPPNCLRPPPAACPTGMTGIPPNCRPAQTQPQPPRPPVLQAPQGQGCAPPKKLNPQGQCV